MSTAYAPGDPIIYRLTKRSTLPGPRARDVYAEPSGDGYTYDVEKFWVVSERLPDGKLVVRTRRGKVRTVANDDPNLRRARWWERLLYSSRFPRLAQ
jgi:cyanate lyase